MTSPSGAVAEDVADSSPLARLPARPPTPPREAPPAPPPLATVAAVAALARLAEKSVNIQNTPPTSVPTPDSIDSIACTATAEAVSSRKRVEWSVEHVYHEPYGQDHDPPSGRSFDSHSDKDRPVKGILKQTTRPGQQQQHHQQHHQQHEQWSNETSHANMAEMLESMLQQLAGDDIMSRRDAYQTLSRALRVSDNLPDRAVLRDNMRILTEYIERDITIKPPNNPADTGLAANALDVLSTFCSLSGVAASIPHEFAVFFIDHCIRSFEEPTTPRVVVRYLMSTLYLQKFSPKVLTSDRVSRLLASLRNLDARKSIIVARNQIYYRLTCLCRDLMIRHTAWVFDMFTDLLTTMKEIRPYAIALGLHVGFHLVREKAFSRKVMEVLQEKFEEKATFADFYLQRLNDMLKDPDTIADVPKLWSVMILLMRNNLDRWSQYTPLLGIIQQCFNNSDAETRREANMVWGRLIYVNHVEGAAFRKQLYIMAAPLQSQLARKRLAKTPDEVKRVRQSLYSNICILYYYAFKPENQATVTDVHWDACKNIMANMDGNEHARFGIRILTSLLDVNSTGRLWNEERAADATPCVPEELSGLDPKWVRKSSSRVLAAARPYITKSFTDLANTTSAMYKLWWKLVACIATAAAKDIKVSPETVAFVAEVMAVMADIWFKGPTPAGEQSSEQASGVFMNAMREFFLVLYKQLGPLPFTEKMLAMGKNHSFTAVSTPSHRLTLKYGGAVRSPLSHLFVIFCTQPANVPDDAEYASFISQIFTPFIESKSDAKARSKIAQDLVNQLPGSVPRPYGPWVLASQHVASSLCRVAESSFSSEDGHLGHQFRDVVNLLGKGVKLTPNLPQAAWLLLFDELKARVHEDCGDAGCAIIMIEPLSRVMLDHVIAGKGTVFPTRISAIAHHLVRNAVHPKDKQASDAARRTLWGTTDAAKSYDPFDNFYKLVAAVMQHLYEEYTDDDTAKVAAPLLQEVSDLLVRTPTDLVFKMISQLQDGIAVWAQDERTLLDSRQDSETSEAVSKITERTCTALRSIEASEKMPLGQIERFLRAAFHSKHRHIVNTAAIMWNTLFGQLDNVNYPDGLKDVLVSVRPYVDIALPGVDPASIESDVPMREYVESQTKSTGALSLSAPATTPQGRRSASPGIVELLPRQQQRKVTPGPFNGKKSGPRSRPRHEDSQIIFEPVISSPAMDNGGSQLLTGRQKEVREQQKDSSALFAELRSSPRVSGRKSPAAPLERAQPKERTPEPDTGYGDFVSSTPTPHRGQTFHLHDDSDPPSSPPDVELRPYPLMTQLSAHAPQRRSSVLQAWQDFSSPVSSSPQKSQRDIIPSSLPEDSGAITPVKGPGEDARLPDRITSTPVEESTPGTQRAPATKSTPEPPPTKVMRSRVTPPTTRSLRSIASTTRSSRGETPKPGQISTPTSRLRTRKSTRAAQQDCSGSRFEQESPIKGISPVSRIVEEAQRQVTKPVLEPEGVQPTEAGPKEVQVPEMGKPAPSNSTGQSFALSDGAERSMLRLVDEHESRQTEAPVADVPQVNVEGPSVVPQADPETEEASERKKRKRAPSTRNHEDRRKRTRSSAGLPSPTQGGDDEAENRAGIPEEAAVEVRVRPLPPAAQPLVATARTLRRRRSVSTKTPTSTPGKSTRSRWVVAEDFQTARGGDLLVKDIAALPGPANSPSSEDTDTEVRKQLEEDQEVASRSQSVSGSQTPGSNHGEAQAVLAAVSNAEVAVSESMADDSMVMVMDVDELEVHEPVVAPAAEVIPGAAVADAVAGIQAEAPAAPLSELPPSIQSPRLSVSSLSAPPSSPPPPTKAAVIMDLLRRGVHELRGEAITRVEMLEIEDMFVDFKRELYEAERRGRQ